MKILKHFVISILSLVVLTSTLPSSAKAASPYDNLIASVDNVSTTCIYTGSPSSKIDWTSRWYEFIKNYDASGDTNLQSAKNLLISNVAAGKGYGVFSGGNIVDAHGFHVIAYDTNQVTPEFKDTGSPNNQTGQYTFGFRDATINSNFFVIYFIDYGQHGYPCGDVILGANNHMVGMQPFSNYYKHDGGNPLRPLMLVDDVAYPTGYEGSIIKDGSTIDEDDDGLSVIRELQQGTSDTNKDTDGDGINDYVESQWYPSRSSIFCGVSECAYPNPVKKDIYVEIDWMNDTANNRLLKPTTTQLNILTSIYTSQNVNLHLDTGQYGGGNVLPTYIKTLKTLEDPLATDFEDLKSAHFASNRAGIWRYMIYGYEYAEHVGSSGVAEVSGDDIFVSGGTIQDTPGIVSEDRAIAGTMAHEIGHTLCLSDVQVYTEQPTECVYGGIDSYANKPANYKSVMNYRYQLTDDDDMGVVDYSDGSHGFGDHDDWSAALANMGNFSKPQTALGAKSATLVNKAMDPALLSKPGPKAYDKSSQNQEVKDQPSVDVSQDNNSPQTKHDTHEQEDKKDTNVERVSKDDDSGLSIAPVAVAGGVVLAGGVGVLVYNKVIRNKRK